MAPGAQSSSPESALRTAASASRTTGRRNLRDARSSSSITPEYAQRAACAMWAKVSARSRQASTASCSGGPSPGSSPSHFSCVARPLLSVSAGVQPVVQGGAKTSQVQHSGGAGSEARSHNCLIHKNLLERCVCDIGVAETCQTSRSICARDGGVAERLNLHQGGSRAYAGGEIVRSRQVGGGTCSIRPDGAVAVVRTHGGGRTTQGLRR